MLYRHAYDYYQQDSHTQKVVIKGTVQYLRASILHDNRKSLRHWVSSQNRYIRLEAQKLAQNDLKI